MILCGNVESSRNQADEKKGKKEEKKMIRFNSDYTEGCHPAILEKLAETNMEQTAGYGEDEYCEQARTRIRRACGDESVDVHFLVGGTQTNVTVISAALKHYQGVITATTGHINVHETGALEAWVPSQPRICQQREL